MVVAKVVRGSNPKGLMRYLLGPSRDDAGRNPHEDPRIIGSWRGDLDAMLAALGERRSPVRMRPCPFAPASGPEERGPALPLKCPHRQGAERLSKRSPARARRRGPLARVVPTEQGAARHTRPRGS